MFRKFSSWLDEYGGTHAKKDRYRHRNGAYEESCEAKGCTSSGIHRAPKSTSTSGYADTNEWHWFCLEHVRQYNAKWNYYDQMGETEINNEWHSDMSWQRPSWSFGNSPAKQPVFEDPFGIFTENRSSTKTPEHTPQSDEMQALALLGLGYPYTQQDLRHKYHALVKKFHPDLNSGCKESEEKIKQINQAYHLLKKQL
jgi:hypothetical protein